MSGRCDWRGAGAVVTGASSGIGEALAMRLAREGAQVVLVARRETELDRVAAAIGTMGGKAHTLARDLADIRTAFRAGEEAERLLDTTGVDILVNNAGFGGRRPVVDWSLDEIERMTRVNYLSGVAITKAVLPGMIERRRGTLVFVASVAGKVPVPLEAPYAATKSAMLSFAEALSYEVEDEGISVLNVCPGVIDTPFFGEEDLAAMPEVARRGMVPVDGLVDSVMKALARGRREVTYPGSIAAAYPVKALAPGFFHRSVKKNTST
jgi:short-subunit dehydrogenase